MAVAQFQAGVELLDDLGPFDAPSEGCANLPDRREQALHADANRADGVKE